MPQKNWAPMMMSKTTTARPLPRASKKICAGAAMFDVDSWKASALSYPAFPCTAAQTAISRIYPKITEYTTDFQMPFGPLISAWCVSSVMCAEAS